MMVIKLRRIGYRKSKEKEKKKDQNETINIINNIIYVFD